MNRKFLVFYQILCGLLIPINSAPGPSGDRILHDTIVDLEKGIDHSEYCARIKE